MQNNLFDYLYIPRMRFVIGLIVFSLAGSAYLGYLTPILISALYSSVEGSKEALDAAVINLVFLFCAEYLFQVCYQVSISKYVQHLIQHVRKMSFSNWVKSHEVSQSAETKYPMGEVLARILSDTEAVIELVSSGSFKIIIDFAFIISCLFSFMALNTTSGITLIIAEVLACILLIIGSKQMGKVYMMVRKSMGDLSRVLANLTSGFRFIYHTPNGNYATKKSKTVFEDFLTKQLKANVWDAGYFAIAESLFPLLLAVLVLIFPYSNIMEVAILAAIIDLIQRSISPIKEIASKISSIQRAKAGVIRIQEFNSDILKLPRVDFEDQPEKIKLKQLSVDINSYTYPKRSEDQESFALKDIKFKASSGELIGVVGLSGSGKSTVLKILAADIIPEDYTIKVNCESGKILEFNASEMSSLDSYKRQVSIVSQDSHVFTETLRFNITLGQNEGQFGTFWNSVIESIPYLKKWEVEPEDMIKPKELSLGQKQLVSALRSCFLSKPIVLFDEISSGLDSELEEGLRKLVLLIQKKSLTFIVAHRIETIVKANQIIVMDEGKVESRGVHSDLLSRSATYKAFIEQIGAKVEMT